jgi:hypothetical protein
VQFEGERLDKITRGACPCNDDKVIFEDPLNWTTRSFIFAKQGEYEHGPPTAEPNGELSCEWPYLAKLAESRMKMVRFRLKLDPGKVTSTNSRLFVQVKLCR